MPRKFRLYWDRHLKYWFKKFDGKKVYFGKGKSKYVDVESYNEAVAKYEEYLDTQRVKLVKQNRFDNFRVDFKGERPHGTIAGAIDRYYAWQQSRITTGEISIGRLKSIRSSIRTFEEFIGKGSRTKAYEPDGVKTHINHERMKGYHKRLKTKYENGTYSILTSNMHWRIAVDFVKYCYELGWLPTNIRGLNRYKFSMRNSSRGRGVIKVFSVKQVRKLFAHARDRMDYPMDLFIALALNCGFTSVELGSLKDKHLVWDSSHENIIRIEKERSKTKQFGQWLIWDSTNTLLKRWLTKRSLMPTHKLKTPEYIFYGRNGQRVNSAVELINKTSKDSVVNIGMGYINDAVGRSFTRLIKTHFPEMNGMSFKTFRKSGVSEIVKLNLPNTLLIEQLYLAHKPTSVARIYYSKVEADTLDEALQRINDVYHLNDLIEDVGVKDERRRLAYNDRKKKEMQKRRDLAKLKKG